MALQTHSAALHPLKTLQIVDGAAGLASAGLRATIRATLIAAPYSMAAADVDAILVRVKHLDILVWVGTLYMSDCGDVVTATSMPYGVGEKRQIRNCKELFGLAKLFTDAAYDLRLELYS